MVSCQDLDVQGTESLFIDSERSLSSLTVSGVEKENGYHNHRFIQKQTCPSVKQNGKTHATLSLHIYIGGLSELINEAWHIEHLKPDSMVRVATCKASMLPCSSEF